jgi:UDP-N-acetylmuramoyl-L-alanyl-D-glutamate--2,6-diaminopimelate ligase
MRARGATHAVMEVSSIALVLGRVSALRFRVGVFNNLTQDHLDFHGTMHAYAEAKALLFTRGMCDRAVIHIDDPFGAELAERASCPVVRVRTSLSSEGDVVPLSIESRSTGTSLVARVGRETVALSSRLVGLHNVENLLVALGVASALDLDIPRVAAALSHEAGAPGRLERCDGPGDDIVVLVDYAHTPDALRRVLLAVRGDALGSRLLCVFGCGGDRDAKKRDVMGEIAATHADVVVITNDNPRTESPVAIAECIEQGVRRVASIPRVEQADLGACSRGYAVELDRRKAIALAVASARPSDIVLIAGKGHETYQVIGEQKHAFDDREQARAALVRRGRELRGS